MVHRRRVTNTLFAAFFAASSLVLGTVPYFTLTALRVSSYLSPIRQRCEAFFDLTVKKCFTALPNGAHAEFPLMCSYFQMR